MNKQKEEIGKLIESLGNDKPNSATSPDFMEWMEANNPLSDLQLEPNKKSKCKSGNCGNNVKTFTIVGVILFFVMWAGYGLFSFIEHMVK